MGAAEAGRHWSIPRSTVGAWEKTYMTTQISRDGHPIKDIQDSYSIEFKAKVVADAVKLGPVEAGRRWSVPRTTVGAWKRKYMKQISHEQLDTNKI